MMEGKYYVTVMALIFFNMITLLLSNFSSSLSIQISSTLKRLLRLDRNLACDPLLFCGLSVYSAVQCLKDRRMSVFPEHRLRKVL